MAEAADQAERTPPGSWATAALSARRAARSAAEEQASGIGRRRRRRRRGGRGRGAAMAAAGQAGGGGGSGVEVDGEKTRKASVPCRAVDFKISPIIFPLFMCVQFVFF